MNDYVVRDGDALRLLRDAVHSSFPPCQPPCQTSAFTLPLRAHPLHALLVLGARLRGWCRWLKEAPARVGHVMRRQ
jgi:hypothetical protein